MSLWQWVKIWAKEVWKNKDKEANSNIKKKEKEKAEKKKILMK